jgi:hypothetical protein
MAVTLHPALEKGLCLAKAECEWAEFCREGPALAGRWAALIRDEMEAVLRDRQGRRGYCSRPANRMPFSEGARYANGCPLRREG